MRFLFRIDMLCGYFFEEKGLVKIKKIKKKKKFDWFMLHSLFALVHKGFCYKYILNLNDQQIE